MYMLQIRRQKDISPKDEATINIALETVSDVNLNQGRAIRG